MDKKIKSYRRLPSKPPGPKFQCCTKLYIASSALGFVFFAGSSIYGSIPNLSHWLVPGGRFATACRLSPDVLLSCCDMMSKAFPLIMCKAK